jgi:hypothetical protein
MLHLTLATFARRHGFKSPKQKGFRAHLIQLEKLGAIRIVQGGFRGHSAEHQKKIEIQKPIIVERYFKGFFKPDSKGQWRDQEGRMRNFTGSYCKEPDIYECE